MAFVGFFDDIGFLFLCAILLTNICSGGVVVASAVSFSVNIVYLFKMGRNLTSLKRYKEIVGHRTLMIYRLYRLDINGN